MRNWNLLNFFGLQRSSTSFEDEYGYESENLEDNLIDSLEGFFFFFFFFFCIDDVRDDLEVFVD